MRSDCKTACSNYRISNQYYIKLIAVPLDKPEIGKVQTTCNSVSFSWSKDTKNYVDIESYHVTVTRATDERIVRATKVSGNTSQAMFTDLEESTKYKLTVKQITAAANIGYESSKIIGTIKCMFRFYSISVVGCSPGQTSPVFHSGIK